MHDDPNSVMEQASQREQSQGYAPMFDDFSKLRLALQAGPTPGPWHSPGLWEVHDVDHNTIADTNPIALRDDIEIEPTKEERQCGERTAEFIAAANPQTIAALLAELDAARVDAARYQLLSGPDFDDREGVFVRNTREGAGAELDAEIARLKELGVEGEK